ncbi:MAG: Beta-lactamase [Parcubacteria bacterium C7867-001]|nr:MAG: Beta-lactamase [Parcubacteria bacterium C7867-001]
MKKLQLRIPEKRLLLLGGACFAAGILATMLALALYNWIIPATKSRALRESDIPTASTEYRFIDPLIATKGINYSAKYGDMQHDIEAIIDERKKSNLITATVLFRDIYEQGGFVINPDEKYTPASLLKVPVMMAYFKIAETDPSILSHRLFYTGLRNTSDVQQIKSNVQLAIGKSYTIEELIERMIRYSDNNATDLLTHYLSDTDRLETYVNVFRDLGVDLKNLTDYSDNLTVSEYTIFLRALYNATYLNRTYSELALEILSETDFTEGIESGVPNGVLVAEKFGEVRMTDGNGNLLGKQINNCGIVYYPEHPYILCVMTKGAGDSIPFLEDSIASISRAVYKDMQRLYP